MKVRVILPIHVLDSSYAFKRPDREVSVQVEPGEYELIPISNPYVPGTQFFTVPGTGSSGAVKAWWHMMARLGRVEGDPKDGFRVFKQEKVLELLIEVGSADCTPIRQAEIFEEFFPGFTSRVMMIQNRELIENVASALLYNQLFRNQDRVQQDIIGLLPLIVAALCDRTEDAPFALVDWKKLRS